MPKQRGRPKGSTRYARQDAVTLQQVADLINRNPKLSKTAAIKQVTGRPGDETLTRRLRDKLTPEFETLLAEARARAEQRTRVTHADWRPILTGLQAFSAVHNDAIARIAASDTFRQAIRTAQECSRKIEQAGWPQGLRNLQARLQPVQELSRRFEEAAGSQWLRAFQARFRELGQSGLFKQLGEFQAAMQRSGLTQQHALEQWGRKRRP